MTPGQLLVEGRTAEIFFREMVERYRMTDRIQVRDFGSIGELRPYLVFLAARAEFRERVSRLGIVRDAEQQPVADAFRSVCDALNAVSLPSPTQPGSVEGASFRVGVFILPDCSGPGMIETLCHRVLAEQPSNGPGLTCVEAYLDCLQANGKLPRNRDKARVWAFLAAQDLSDPQVGTAARRNVFPWETPAFRPLVRFLEEL